MRTLCSIAAGLSIAGLFLSCLLAGEVLAQQNARDDLLMPVTQQKGRPAKIGGCWTGPMTDDNGLTGSVTFKILQSKKKIVTDTGHNHGSRIDIEYDVGGFAKGPIAGAITKNSIKFTATFGNGGCRGSGNGTVTTTPKEIKGSFDYTAACPSGLVHLTYEVQPGACPSS